MRINKQYFRMLEIQLFVLLCLISGRHAYNRHYLADEASEYSHDTSFNESQVNPNEPPDLFSCCKISFGSCRSSCENLSLVQLSKTGSNGKDAGLSELRLNCPSVQMDFWQCMNTTLHAVQRGSEWSGRLCCSHAITINCQNTCATSMSIQDTLSGCRRSDEQTLFDCLEKQENGDNCCGNARTSECLQACRDIFQSQKTATKEQRQLVEHACNDNNTNLKVLNCVREIMDVTPVENSKQYLPCCGHSRSAICRETCKNILEIGETMQEIIDTLSKGGCGPPLPHEPLWQCFLSGNHHPVHTSADGTAISQINEIGMDSAKLHCCHKALSPKCRRLCSQTFSNDWTETRGDFESECYAELNEISLRQCLDEVDEPCELGCDGLSFCTNFNNRPTELFRSCNVNADYAAQADLVLWRDNESLTLPGLILPIKDIDKCEPEAWQAISCILQIKPCSRTKHTTQICRDDCYDLLAKCIDWTRMETRHSPESICSKFSVDSENTSSPCVSLKPYLQPSDEPQNSWPAMNHQIISPCRGHTCNTTEVCVPDNKRDHHGVLVSTVFRCVPGCPLGETSSYLVPVGAYARIPVSMKQKGCFKVCRCMENGRLDDCLPLPCMSLDSCKLGDRQIEHGAWLNVECNICSCYAGDITCTKKQCRIPGISDHYTSLPCNCAPHHVPVCGRNGYTYPSECVSKCAGLQVTDIEFRSCRDNNPCRDAKCPSYAQCVENRQICLSVAHKPCRQYQCINTTSNCRVADKPVCSTEGQTYASMCHLVKAKSTLAYAGRCIDSCRKNPVCGINGISYKSECEAWSDYSIADYDGDCREIGLLTNSMGPRCASVKCNSYMECSEVAIIPPGACCPVCGGAIRIIYSRKQIDRALYALKGKNTEILTLRGILRALDNIIQVAHCRISGYLTIESDIFVIVHTTGANLSRLQHEACFREAEKIATLIDTQSHRITSELSLSALTVANVVRPQDLDLQFSSANTCYPYISVLAIALIVIYLNYH